MTVAVCMYVYLLHCLGGLHTSYACMLALPSTGHRAEDSEHVAGTLSLLGELCWVSWAGTTPLCSFHGTYIHICTMQLSVP